MKEPQQSAHSHPPDREEAAAEAITSPFEEEAAAHPNVGRFAGTNTKSRKFVLNT